MIERRDILRTAGGGWLAAGALPSEAKGAAVAAVAPADRISDPLQPLTRVMPERGAGLVNWIRKSAGAAIRSVADVLDDTPSIMDFIGLTERVAIRSGTSRADLSAEFRAAAATGSPLVVPAGVYNLAGDIRFTGHVSIQPGVQLRRLSGTLEFAGGLTASPGAQIFFGYLDPHVLVDSRSTPEGWVDWFGDGAEAIETAHRVFQTARLGPRDYHVTRTVLLDRSHRQVIGCGGSAEGEGGTRIVLTGPASANQAVVRLGTGERAHVLKCARRLNVRGINTFRDGATRPAASGRREDAVPGWDIRGWYEGRLEDCFDYGSAIHYRIAATVSCTVQRCGGVRPKPGQGGSAPDFYTAFCIGGHAPAFGFIGANASLSVLQCGCAGGAAGDPSRVGIYLFGYIGDTWIDSFEMSQLEFGIYVDGADRGGRTLAELSAHQDVRVNNCVLDAVLHNAITLRNLNAGAGLQLRGNYAALNGTGEAILVENSEGLVTIDGADCIANSALENCGLRILGSKRVQANAVALRDFRVGVEVRNSAQLRLTPTIHRVRPGGAFAVQLEGASRSYVAPLVDGVAGAWQGGVAIDANTNYCEINVSAINYGAFVRVTSAGKLQVTGSAVDADRFGSGNLRSGVVG
ncbi:hypothetical protein HT136_09910 [Novosphingobium profundi]|uniref:hypothetical protein n=1 Tax=Novosphingobium profundi TaxID=1774954 RepID=UPI001BDA1FF5|nr:hypothetical protein [Novosphingobium profundi]MBT0668681.1 hypothetical protein [Novosphingobium profundi]